MEDLPYMNAKDEAFYHPSVLDIGKHASRHCSLHKSTQDADKGVFVSLLDPTSDKLNTPSPGAPSLSGAHLPGKPSNASTQ